MITILPIAFLLLFCLQSGVNYYRVGFQLINFHGKDGTWTDGVKSAHEAKLEAYHVIASFQGAIETIEKSYILSTNDIYIRDFRTGKDEKRNASSKLTPEEVGCS